MTTDRIRVIPADDASNGQTANDNLVSLTEIEVRTPAGAGQIRTQRFDAWGRVEQAVGAVPTYGYTGREPDATGLTFYRARYYHPELGRFVSRDPLGLAAGINPYAYAGGNPVLFNDPDGMTARLASNSARTSYETATDWEQPACGVGSQCAQVGVPITRPVPGLILHSGTRTTGSNPSGTGDRALDEAFGLGQRSAPINLMDKMAAEISGITQRNLGPEGEVYSLRATRAGDYPNVRGGTTRLEAGEVYRYGETTTKEPLQKSVP